MLNWQQLINSWAIARVIDDGTTATGIATISADFAYTERVEMLLPNGQSLPGTRAYKLVPAENSLSMYYADGPQTGELFQHFVVSDNYASSHHVCGADNYRSTLICDLPDSFTLIHEVTGPRKNYVMRSVYRATT